MSGEETLWEALDVSKERVRELWRLWNKLYRKHSEVSEIIKKLEHKDDLTTMEKLALMFAVGYALGMERAVYELRILLEAGEAKCA